MSYFVKKKEPKPREGIIGTGFTEDDIENKPAPVWEQVVRAKENITYYFNKSVDLK
jgi:hypothetical protein